MPPIKVKKTNAEVITLVPEPEPESESENEGLGPAKTDIWIPIYIGDFLADTAHLDATLTGAYLLLIFHCWRKKSLPNNIPALMTIAKLHCVDASSMIQALLEEFFEQDVSTATWHQNRLERERVRWAKKKTGAVERAKKAAKGRWNAPSNA